MLEYSGWSTRTPGDRVLMALKIQGRLSTAAIGKKLGITGEAARQQLMRLAEQQLVVATSEAKGVGRPQQLWELTAAAQSRFPDTCASLTEQLLDIIRTHMGESALDMIINVRESETQRRYLEELSGKHLLRDRVAALAALRSEEGYMADWREEDDGSFLLIENHCPISPVAAACGRFCSAELEMFGTALGPTVSIDRTEHIIKGGRRCTYVIRETDLFVEQGPE
ncbi:helix-turn-helix transcriptional regulator [Rhizorhapis suberifaciens]|uniref:Putative ArsR family transcriptional regulator n=1 Tax=Rhizorhapis suberifaciens TaxID=13656 RepID=A0A840HZB9_9SPHN|nr:metalloregulator ArsR/SmtB family transcription factor [Rhizorhapis suberifaciens]MBB4642858.1 putative ArsR family transcriptional regulator [Rhizorhapis suberifaciens]